MKNSKRFLNIITAVFFAILLALNLLTLTFVSAQAATIMLSILRIINVIAAVILSFVTATHYRNLNKANGGGDKDFGYYFKKIWITVAMIFGMSLAISVAGGMLGNGILGGIRTRMAEDSPFLQGLIVKLPLFIIYLAIMCNMFVQQGYRDANRKVFNSHLKTLIVAFAFILMMPGTVYDSIYNTAFIDTFWENVQSVLSPGRDVYIIDYPEVSVNPDYNIFLPALTVTLTAVIQIAAALFAYGRGKQTFLKKRLNPAEHETDEKC